jgi:uncharacterized RDD family membrane protein YckC
MTRARRGIVTPEAVLLEFETAGLGSRLLALVVDLVVLTGLFFGLGLVTSLLSLGSVVVSQVLATVGTAVLLFGYPVYGALRWDGRSVGKRSVGLRVVTLEGGPVTFRHAAVRSALMLVDYAPLGVPAALAIFFSENDQRLGDMAAGTLVMRERTGAAFPIPVTFPPLPGWEQFARSLDVGALRPAQYAVVRSFLIRVFELSPPARQAIGYRLAASVAAAIRHTPTPGMAPEPFLVAVAAAYQLRHGGPPVALPPWISPWGNEADPRAGGWRPQQGPPGPTGVPVGAGAYGYGPYGAAPVGPGAGPPYADPWVGR